MSITPGLYLSFTPILHPYIVFRKEWRSPTSTAANTASSTPSLVFALVFAVPTALALVRRATRR